MKFEEALALAITGRIVRRDGWPQYWSYPEAFTYMVAESIVADDWEVKPDPKPKMIAYWNPYVSYLTLNGPGPGGKTLFWLLPNDQAPEGWERAPEYDEK